MNIVADGMFANQAGLLLALMMDRCLFVDFPFFNEYFEHELDFSWERHAERLLAHGHNVTAPENMPMEAHYIYSEIATTWLFSNIREHFGNSYGVEVKRDLDWHPAVIVNNPFYQVRLYLAIPYISKVSFARKPINCPSA